MGGGGWLPEAPRPPGQMIGKKPGLDRVNWVSILRSHDVLFAGTSSSFVIPRRHGNETGVSSLSNQITFKLTPNINGTVGGDPFPIVLSPSRLKKGDSRRSRMYVA